MNKSQLIDAIAETTGVSKTDTDKVVEGYHKVVGETLATGGTISLAGFGTWKTSERAARKGRNPQTGAEIEIAASTAPVFKAGKALKTIVNAK